jgi:hypothetical protein
MTMRNTILLGMVVMLALLAVACGGTADAGSTGDNPAGVGTGLTEDYPEALSVPAQLIVGSLQLEESELAIDEALAAELLPLWRAYQSLSDSDTVAEAELQALLNQIQDTMSPEQIEAIASMQLTAEDATALIQEQGGAFGPGDQVAADADGTGNAERGFPAGDFAVGGLPDGVTGGGFGGLSPEQQATALAKRSGDEPGDFATRGLLNALVTSLQVKAG